MDAVARRRRLVARHHLGGDASDLRAAVRDLVVLHSSDPTTPHLALWARVPGVQPEDLDHALCVDRDLWRLHAMRRTIWVALADEVPLLEAAAGRKVAAAERRRLARRLQDQGGDPGVLDVLSARVLAALAAAPGTATRDLRPQVEGFDTAVRMGSGTWAQEVPLGPRVLFLLAMELQLVRGGHTGTWRSSEYAWSRAVDWFADAVPEPLEVHDAQARLARRYLDRFGPATFEDLRWWTGWTTTDTRRALATVAPVEVELDAGTGLATDLEVPPAPDEPVVTLLPSLDPTAMGWKQRGHYLDDDHTAQLFDRNGNVGPTVWLDGRVIGGWGVRDADDGVRVATHLLEDVGSDVTGLVRTAADRLTAWLDGPVTPRFPTPLERRLRTVSPAHRTGRGTG